MSSVLLLDVSRLIWRARRRGPTGIDRVELAYARHFIAGQDKRTSYAVLHLMGFLFALSPRAGRRLVAALAARWNSAPATRWGNLRSLVRLYGTLLMSRWHLGPTLRRAIRRAGGTPVFIVVSHHHVSRAHTILRIRRTLGARTACLIHDLIPMEYPEYCKPGWDRRYERLLQNIGRCFDAVIANSESTARALRASLEGAGDSTAQRVTIRATPLGVRSFSSVAVPVATTPDRPYFVVLGTIEPRKNHLLLLNLWARLATQVSAPPRLLVIGFRGWENEQVIDMLERSRRLRGLVEERSNLSDLEVAELLHGARALLLPSLAEGFGLPLGEALAFGVPAICSDLPALREVGRDVPEYLDPLDIRAWEEAVLDYSRTDSLRRAEQMRRLGHWSPPSWREHFTAVEQLIQELSGTRRPALLEAGAPEPLPQNR